MFVRTYQDEKGLTLSRKSTFEPIEDDILQSTVENNDNTIEVSEDAIIVGTQHFNVHYNCAQKLPSEESYVRCSKCNVLQSLNQRDFQVACNIFFQNKDEVKMLKACTETIMKINGRSDFVLSKEIEELLLKPIRLNVHYIKI